MANNANSSDGVGENTWSTYSNNGNKTAKIVLKTFVVRAQNNTFRQQLSTDTISNKKGDYTIAAINISAICC